MKLIRSALNRFANDNFFTFRTPKVAKIKKFKDRNLLSQTFATKVGKTLMKFNMKYQICKKIFL